VTLPNKIIPIVIIASIASAGVMAGLVYAPSSLGQTYGSPTYQGQKPLSQYQQIDAKAHIVTGSADPFSSICKIPDSDIDASFSQSNAAIAAESSKTTSNATNLQGFTVIIIPNTGCLHHNHPHCIGTVNVHAHNHNGRHVHCHRDRD